MSKLENASGNLKEILCAIADGETVQFMEHNDGKWIDYQLNFESVLCQEMLDCKWRKKPDFEEWWATYVVRYDLESEEAQYIASQLAWDAAMEHKAND